MSYQGPEIKNKDLIKGKHVSVVMHIFQEINTEKNPKARCKNYPYKNFWNYSECDKNFVYENILKNTFGGYMPFWATEDLSNVTQMRLKYT